MLLVSFDRVGPGDEPPRPVSQYWSKDGRLLAEFDHAFHAPDVPAYEVARLRAEVGRLEDRCRRFQQVPQEAATQAPAAINSAVQEVA